MVHEKEKTDILPWQNVRLKKKTDILPCLFKRTIYYSKLSVF